MLGAAFTFWGQYNLWRQIDRGLASIPWGSLWGGEAHGDMNNLRLAGWSDQQIIDAYTTLGNVCLLILLGVLPIFCPSTKPAPCICVHSTLVGKALALQKQQSLEQMVDADKAAVLLGNIF